MANPNQLVIKIKVSAGQSPNVIDALERMDGVDRVESLSSQRLRLIYDVTRVNWQTISAELSKIGISTGEGWLGRWRNSWRAFIEENTRENLNYKPACCSKPPAGAGMKSRSPRDN